MRVGALVGWDGCEVRLCARVLTRLSPVSFYPEIDLPGIVPGKVGVLLAQAASSSAQRQWRSLGARSMLDARSFMISTLRSQVGFAAAVAHARLRLSRLELIGGSGRTAGRYTSAARAFISPTAFEQARGGALGAGGGRVGFAGGGLF